MLDLTRRNCHLPRRGEHIAIDIDSLASIARVRTDNERVILHYIAIFAGMTVGAIVPPQMIIAIDAVATPVRIPDVGVLALIGGNVMMLHQIR